MNTLRADNSYMRLVGQFPLVPIRNKSHLNAAIKVMKELSYKSKSLSQSEVDYLSVLGDLIAQYEKKHLAPSGKVTPIEALQYLMGVSGLKQSDLVPVVGHKSNLSAFLHNKRRLSKNNAMRLSQYFKVSPALFLEHG